MSTIFTGTRSLSTLNGSGCDEGEGGVGDFALVRYLPREVFFGRLDFAGVFVPVCASDFGRFFPATSGSFRLWCSR
jgi:hypothetical protein